MAKPHVSNNEFFTQLTALLEKTQKKTHGSVYLTQKRMTFDTTQAPTSSSTTSPDDPLSDLHPSNPLPLIIRATDGSSTKSDKRTKNPDKIKLSTVVQPEELEGFFARYAEVCKAGMQSLKKRDRSKRKKEKGKKKKGGGEETKG